MSRRGWNVSSLRRRTCLLSSRPGEEERSSLRFVSMARPFVLPVVSGFAADIVLTGYAVAIPHPGPPLHLRWPSRPPHLSRSRRVPCSRLQQVRNCDRWAPRRGIGPLRRGHRGVVACHPAGQFESSADQQPRRRWHLAGDRRDGTCSLTAGTGPQTRYSDVDKVTSDCNAVQ